MVRIIGTGSYVPEKVLTNADLERMVETSDEWIYERTGIRARHIAAEDETTTDMALKASRRALKRAGVRAEDLDLIIMGTVTGDVKMPASAAILQAKLGAGRATAFDVSAACAGSIYALSIAEMFIRLDKARVALVIGAELLSRIVDWTDRNTCVLFGDAAGAMVLARSPGAEEEGRGILSTHLHTDGQQAEILDIPGGGVALPFSEEVMAKRQHFVRMNGREVFKHAVRHLVEVSREALAANGLRPEQIDHVVAHQANIRILEAVLNRLGIPMEKAITNIERVGNTSSASLPMTLDEAARDGRLQPGQLLLMMAIGAGLSWGGAVVRW
ncbi:MAG: ketoacyl-ACP synthase III [Deltaproteobacteria bacterium]|nr:ketoacyl-ACP synthase III [Deltaproteobacteria bacterium]